MEGSTPLIKEQLYNFQDNHCHNIFQFDDKVEGLLPFLRNQSCPVIVTNLNTSMVPQVLLMLIVMVVVVVVVVVVEVEVVVVVVMVMFFFFFRRQILTIALLIDKLYM